jgi:hypothetical protein
MAGQDHLLAKAFLAAPGGFSNSIILGQVVVASAGTTLDPTQCSLAGTGASVPGTPPAIGVAAENMDLVKIQTGKAYISVAIAGVAFVISNSGAVAVGASLIPSVGVAGRVDAVTPGATARNMVGIALTVGVAAGDLIMCLLTPGGKC